MIALPNPKVGESQCVEKISIPKITPIHNDWCMHTFLDADKVKLFKLIPLGGENQGIGSIGYLVRIFAKLDLL